MRYERKGNELKSFVATLGTQATHLTHRTLCTVAESHYVNGTMQYSSDEQQKILEKVNSCSHEELARYRISPTRLARLSNHRQKFGSFANLDDVLKASGMTPETLDRFCNSVLCPSTTERSHGVRVQLIKPNLTNSARDAAGITEKIPNCDAYVMEEMGTPVQLAKNLLNALQTVQLRAMFIALLSASSLNSFGGNGFLQDKQQKVFFLKSHLPARLFQTLIGSERVSAQSVVEKIFQGRSTSEALNYTPIIVPNHVQDYYHACDSAEREMLCQSLLLTMTFMDVAIHQNERSLAAVTTRRISV
ncbi:transcription elongation factor, mitochondrial isoform X3 [Schistocerca serialis cubense]|uniref:transcription elongation factor, mitochondrial isoform X3 n=1 Tax=Schistocerca serialis cubense TaxID=2023355 RepID=UPI00214E9D9E|nr:transcription elongation factor, mitochondrial isoform X3 [Schistocerca serialis cubense]